MLKDAIIALGLRLGGTALWLGLTVLLARQLDVQSFGLVFFVINVSLVGGLIGVVGYDVTVLRFGSEYWREGAFQRFSRILREGRIVALGAGAVLTTALVLLTVAGVQTPVTGSGPLALLVGACICATSVMAVHRDALRGADRLPQALFGGSIIRSLVPLAASLLLAAVGLLSAMSVVVAYLFALCCALAYEVWQICALRLPRPRGRINFPHLPVAAGIWPGEASAIVLARATGILIGLQNGMDAAALFLAAERIAQLGKFLSDAVRTSIGPMLARAQTPEALNEAVARASLLMLLAGAAGALALAVTGYLFLWVLGPAYTPAFPVLLILLVAQSSWSILGPTAMIMNMTGLQKIRSLVNAVGAVALIAILWNTSGVIVASAAFATIVWLVNAVLWLVIFRLKGVKSGVFGLSRETVHSILSEERDGVSYLFRRLRP